MRLLVLLVASNRPHFIKIPLAYLLDQKIASLGAELNDLPFDVSGILSFRDESSSVTFPRQVFETHNAMIFLVHF